MTEPVLRDKKEKTPVEPTLIGLLDSGNDILMELVRKHHSHLASLNILLLCTNKEIKSGGRSRPGKVQKMTPILKYFSRKGNGDEYDVMITVSLPSWNDAEHMKRTAIIDSLLTSIETVEDETTGALKVSIIGPQVAEFAEIVERYGAYNEGLEDLRNVLEHNQQSVADAVKVLRRPSPDTTMTQGWAAEESND